MTKVSHADMKKAAMTWEEAHSQQANRDKT